jgi:hypothetical protein
MFNISDKPMNYSASFIVSKNCLDTCPKCGQNVCEHTSIADVINLPNSVSQDFSTYSSDSSLIKQLFNESSSNITNLNNRISLSGINQNHYIPTSFLRVNNEKLNYHRQHFYTQNNAQIDTYNGRQINNFYTYNSKPNKYDQKNITINNFMPSYTLRPLSCQVMIIDTETSDKLIRDFFDASATHLSTENKLNSSRMINKNEPIIIDNKILENSEDSMKNERNNQMKTYSNKKFKNSNKVIHNNKKKIKFSNFRLFLKNHKESKQSTPNRSGIKTSGFVNCLTSSTSSSSCEEIQYKLKIEDNKKFNACVKSSGDDKNVNNNDNIKNEEVETESAEVINRIDSNIKMSNKINESVQSLNSNNVDDDYDDENGYNEIKMTSTNSCMAITGASTEFDQNQNERKLHQSTNR